MFGHCRTVANAPNEQEKIPWGAACARPAVWSTPPESQNGQKAQDFEGVKALLTFIKRSSSSLVRVLILQTVTLLKSLCVSTRRDWRIGIHRWKKLLQDDEIHAVRARCSPFGTLAVSQPWASFERFTVRWARQTSSLRQHCVSSSGQHGGGQHCP